MKKVISIILCLVMVFALSVPAFAAEDVKCPHIYVPGIVTSAVYTDKDNPTDNILNFDKDEITALVSGELAPAFIVYAADKNVDKLAKSVSSAVNEFFADWFNNSDGTAKGNSGAVVRYPSETAINNAGRMVFDYDWRGNPFDIAAELNEYINYITSTGKYDKVALSSHSLGSVVVLTYLSVYGYDKIMGVVLDTPTIDGVTYVGELFCGEAEITSEALAAYFEGVLGFTEYEEILESLLDILVMAGVTDSVSDFLDDALKKIYPTLFKETLVPMFGYWPTIWAMVPEDSFDKAVEYIFDDFCKGQDLSSLRGKIEDYNSLVRKGRKETLRNFDEVGRIGIISRYGFSALPITSSWDLLGDGVVETRSNSLGAITAVAGESFGEDYLKNKDMKYISPDKTVDASACLFPEKTWFVKNLIHVIGDKIVPLHSQILFNEEEATCDSFAVPRFTFYNAQTNSYETDETQPEIKEELTPFKMLLNFLKALFLKIADFFRGRK